MSKTAEKIQPNHGYNLFLLRKMNGDMPQKTLAKEMGCNQQRISQLESQQTISDDVLQKFADYYGLALEDIRDNEVELKVAPVVINNTFNDNSSATNSGYIAHDQNNTYNNPLEEVLKISQEKEELYQKIAQKEEEKVTLLLKHVEQLEKRLEKLESKK